MRRSQERTGTLDLNFDKYVVLAVAMEILHPDIYLYTIFMRKAGAIQLGLV